MKTTTYDRVIPRDLFNESKLLKCLGQVALLVHDCKAPSTLKIEHYGDPFEIRLLEEGSLFVSNVDIQINGKSVIMKTTYNSEAPYPLIVEYFNEEVEVFNDDGTFTFEFIEFCNYL